MTWFSEGGIPLSDSQIASVDVQALAALYDAEDTYDNSATLAWNAADTVTRYAWNLGYRNPRSAHDGRARTP
jgi:hypothetical protein